MQIIIAESAWQQVCAHLSESAPAEAAGIALVALQACEGYSPARAMRLSDLDEVVIARFVPIPLNASVRSAMRVDVLPSADAPVNARVRELCAAHPRLRAAAFVHSHPFAHGHTAPSRGDSGDEGGHMRPLLLRNREAGLELSFSFIAARAQPWVLCSFAMDAHQQIVELAAAVVVEDNDPRVLKALEQPASIKRHLRRWRRTLAARTQVDALFDGWKRCHVQLNRARAILLCAPSGGAAVWLETKDDVFHSQVEQLSALDPLLRAWS